MLPFPMPHGHAQAMCNRGATGCLLQSLCASLDFTPAQPIGTFLTIPGRSSSSAGARSRRIANVAVCGCTALGRVRGRKYHDVEIRSGERVDWERINASDAGCQDYVGLTVLWRWDGVQTRHSLIYFSISIASTHATSSYDTTSRRTPMEL